MCPRAAFAEWFPCSGDTLCALELLSWSLWIKFIQPGATSWSPVHRRVLARKRDLACFAKACSQIRSSHGLWRREWRSTVSQVCVRATTQVPYMANRLRMRNLPQDRAPVYRSEWEFPTISPWRWILLHLPARHADKQLLCSGSFRSCSLPIWTSRSSICSYIHRWHE